MEDKESTITGAGLLDSFTTPKVKHIGVSVSNNANLYKVRIRKRNGWNIVRKTQFRQQLLGFIWAFRVVFWWFCSDFQRESDAEKAPRKPFVKASPITCNRPNTRNTGMFFSWNHRIKDWYANYMICIWFVIFVGLCFLIFSKWRVFAAATRIWLHLISKSEC